MQRFAALVVQRFAALVVKRFAALVPVAVRRSLDSSVSLVRYRP
jgi:hypothetical protein